MFVSQLTSLDTMGKENNLPHWLGKLPEEREGRGEVSEVVPPPASWLCVAPQLDFAPAEAGCTRDRERKQPHEKMHAGRRVEDLPTPAFTVDLELVKKNAQEMTERFRALGVNLRPHMKTHKTLEGGDLMTGGTRRRIVVSTLAEARFFADGGFDDILYAYPLPFDKVDVCAALTERLESFHVLVDSPEALALLQRRPLHGGKRWKVWLKVDCENGRGLRHTDPAALELAQAIAAGPTELAGVYAHCGNSYHCQGVPDIQTVARSTTQQVLQFTEK
ncbi:UNVERIFIED_CONTAM: hypothetical protein K2H54_000484 [Gekko kuhli]